MLPFDLVFPDVAQRESFAIKAVDDEGEPEETFVFRELYCPDRGCDCRRVMLQVSLVDAEEVVATLGYSFEPHRTKRLGIPQIMLDPMNTQSDLSDDVLALFTRLVKSQPEVRERFIEHYSMWKKVVDDPTHPDHSRVRGRVRGESTVSASKPASAGFAPNQRCYCRSGKKFKNCCGRDGADREFEDARP
jgi:hypothetical protein